MLVFPFNIDITAVHWVRNETYQSLASTDDFNKKNHQWSTKLRSLYTIWLLHLYIYLHISFILDSSKNIWHFRYLTRSCFWQTQWIDGLHPPWAEGGFQNCRKVAETLDTSFVQYQALQKHSEGNKIEHPAWESCNLTLWYLWGWQMCNVSQKKMILLWRKTMSIRLFSVQ